MVLRVLAEVGRRRRSSTYTLILFRLYLFGHHSVGYPHPLTRKLLSRDDVTAHPSPSTSPAAICRISADLCHIVSLSGFPLGLSNPHLCHRPFLTYNLQSIFCLQPHWSLATQALLRLGRVCPTCSISQPILSASPNSRLAVLLLTQRNTGAESVSPRSPAIVCLGEVFVKLERERTEGST